MNKRNDRFTATQVDLAVNVAAAFNLAAGVRVLHEHWRIPRDRAAGAYRWRATAGHYFGQA